MDIKDVYELFKECSSVTTDSRNCAENSLFIALKGSSFNGNTFASSAVSQGCRYALVDEKEYADNENIFFVENCLKTLQSLAREHRLRLGTKVVGITGTNGKTTTKELVATVLSKKYNVLFTQGNLNNHIGVPLTLLNLKKEHELAVIEMGANHPGEIAELVDIAKPNYGIITNVGKAHLEGFGSFEGVVKTKGELYDYLRKEGGSIFLNADNDILCSISDGINKICYGCFAENISNAKIAETNPFLSIFWKGNLIKSNLIGTYNFENILAAITIGSHFGVEDNDIISAIENYSPTNNRSQFKNTENNKLIIDAYNANPTSMAASLQNFLDLKAENKCVILGDMKELGAESVSEHAKIVEMLCCSAIKDVYLVGNQFMQTAKENMKSFGSVEDLSAYLATNPLEGYTILIKGSNSVKLTNVVDLL